MVMQQYQDIMGLKMVNKNQFARFVNSFFSRLLNGEIKKPFYLAYYYSYLYLYDCLNDTNFCNSQKPEEGGVPEMGTGNFPAHPRIVELFIKRAKISNDSNIIDIGSGSGVVLHVAYKLGYLNLSGVEYSKLAYDLSVENLKNKPVKIFHGDAFNLDISEFDTIFFFSPFRGDLAEKFFSVTPNGVKKIILVNHDRKIEPILKRLGFEETFSYTHKIYQNFNGKVFER